MDWQRYQEDFRLEAFKQGKDAAFIHSCLLFAGNLYQQNLPIIFDQKHFCKLVGYSEEYVRAASNAQDRFYTKFSLPKKNGGERIIFAPYPSLKEIQRWILDNILNNIPISKYAKAYHAGSNLLENARFHKKQHIVLNLDIKDFFPSIKYRSVFNIFMKCGYSKQIATILANLCTLDRSLPQGAPSSPAISNIVCGRIDKRISGYTVKNKIRYTRYADDMTFSGDFDIKKLISLVRKILSEEEFILHKDKIRVMKQECRQSVTGIVVNNHLNAPRKLRRDIRSNAYYINKFGIESHVAKVAPYEQNYMAKILGKAHFIKFINPNNMEIYKIIEILNKTKKVQT